MDEREGAVPDAEPLTRQPVTRQPLSFEEWYREARLQLKQKAVPRLVGSIACCLILMGIILILDEQRCIEEHRRSGPEQTFLKLRTVCNVTAIHHECRTESYTRFDIDGVEREYFRCMDLFQYNFSAGAEPQVEILGYDRLGRAEQTCEASTIEKKHLLPTSWKVGDQVACWRPQMDISNMTVQGKFCGRTNCTLADVYSCDVPDCVQITDPAKQFDLVCSNHAFDSVLSRCLIMCGVAVMSSISLVKFSCPQAEGIVLRFGKIVIALGLIILYARVMIFDRITLDHDMGEYWHFLVLFEIVLIFVCVIALEVVCKIDEHDVDPDWTEYEEDQTCSTFAVFVVFYVYGIVWALVLLHHLVMEQVYLDDGYGYAPQIFFYSIGLWMFYIFLCTCCRPGECVHSD
jgi:hypothetical protein